MSPVNVAPAITEERFTRLCVEFANSGQLTGPLLRIPGVRLLVAVGSFTDKRLSRGAVAGHLPSPELEALRKQFRADLTAIVGGRLDGRNLRRLAAAASKVHITPAYTVDSDGKLHSSFRYQHENAAAAIAYGTLLVADEGRTFRADLRQCCLKSCGRFFFKTDTPAATGRDRDRYCEPAHREEAHKATSAARTRRWRAKHK